MNYTELDLTVADLMFPILVELAPTGNTIGYKEIADQIKAQNPNLSSISKITQRHIGRKLGRIWDFTKEQGCPHIGSLVVSKNGECGSGIDSIVKDPVYERLKVKEFNWSNITLDFKNHIAKAQIERKKRVAKKVKRTREEAQQCLNNYWKEQEDKLRFYRDDLVDAKDDILKLIQDGVSPEEALAGKLFNIIRKNNKPSPEAGYVYIGEYVNSETNEPLFDQVKIGYTTDIKAREKALSGGVLGPLKFTIKYYWQFQSDMAFTIEQMMHGRFAPHRKKGEFFHNVSGVLSELVEDEIMNDYSEYLKASNTEE